MSVFTNYAIKGEDIHKKPFSFLLRRLNEAERLYIDTETAAMFNKDVFIKQFIEDKKIQGRKITKAVTKAAETAAEKERNDRALDPYKSYPALLQVLLPKSKDILIIHFNSLKQDQRIRLIEALSDKPLVGHNIKFDIKVLKANYNNFRPGLVWDTMVAHRLIRTRKEEGRFKLSLDAVVAYYTNNAIRLNKEHGISDWSSEISLDMFMYSVNDVKYLELVFERQLDLLNDSACTAPPDVFGCIDAVTQIEMRFVPVLADVELNGIPLNVEKLKKRLDELTKEAEKEMEFFIKRGVNINSPAQLLKLLQKEYPNEVISSTGRPYLMRFKHLPIVEKILAVKKPLKEKSMIEDYLNKWAVYRNKDVRIYPSFFQVTAPTGRMSSNNPNAQQIPRNLKKILYKAPRGKVIVKVDYPNIEARIMSVIANDKVLINLFKKDGDMHRLTASEIMRKKIEEVTDEERYKAKAVNFGLMYGMGVLTFIEYARTNYEIEYTIDEATYVREVFFNTYKGIKRLHNKNSILLAEHYSVVARTLYGRLMKVSKFTDLNNYPVQGSAADLIKRAAYLIHSRAQKQNIDCKIINVVHDEIVCECSTKDLSKAKKLIQNSMESAADNMLLEFHTPVELEVIK